MYKCIKITDIYLAQVKPCDLGLWKYIIKDKISLNHEPKLLTNNILELLCTVQYS